MTRNINDIMRTALYDGRFYKGTIKDFGPLGNDASFSSPPPILQKTGKSIKEACFSDAPQDGQAIVVPVILAGTFTIEMIIRIAKVSSGQERFFEAINIAARLHSGGSNIYWECGVGLFRAGMTYPFEAHIIFTRDASNDGYIYENGILKVSGAVGSDDSTGSLYLGSGRSLTHHIDGNIAIASVYDTHITAEEASLLYEHSRILIAPGSTKRSGIISRAV